MFISLIKLETRQIFRDQENKQRIFDFLINYNKQEFNSQKIRLAEFKFTKPSPLKGDDRLRTN